jgi:hypothetical protein
MGMVMRRFARFLGFLIVVFLIGTVAQATSTIDPTQPALTLPYTSTPIRNNFQAAYNDINALQELIGGGGAIAANTTALSALPITQATYVTRLGFATPGDAPPWLFRSQTGTCEANNYLNDGGSCVDTVGIVAGNSWLAVLPTVLDAREWGQSSLTFTVSATGSDTNNFCINPSFPCGGGTSPSIQHAVVQAAKFAFNLNTNNATINVTAGNVGGATIAGHFLNASGNNAEPCLYIIGAGDSASGTPTHITSAATNGNIEVSGNACVVVKNFDLPLIAGAVGLFTQDGGSHILIGGDISCTGPSTGGTGGEAQACGHSEGGAYIEVTGPNPQITMQGDFAWLFTIGATPGKLTFDPGANGVLSCGTGLTLDPAGGSFLEEGGSAVYLASSWSWASNCTGITGHPVVAQNNSTFINGTGSPLPNVGSFRLFDNSVYSPNPVPEVSTCTNGSVVNTSGINPSNNSFQIAFTGSNSSCTVEFGSFLTGQPWFTNQPICTATLSSGAATKYVVLNYPSNGITIIPSSAFGTDDTVSVNCFAPTEG